VDAVLKPLQVAPGGPRAPWADGFAQLARMVGAALGEGPAVSRRTELFRPLPPEPMAWLLTTFPTYFQNARGERVALAPHHEEFWAWLWTLRPGVAQRTFISIWARGGGKSTSVELGATAVGYFGLRRYALYVCHEEGTPIYDPALQAWMPVEEHPTAQRWQGDGVEVTIAGLPFAPEVVTPEHRYLARRIARRDRGHGKEVEIQYGRPHWIEAQDLDWNTWIGYPIDRTEVSVFPALQQWNHRTCAFEPWECPWFQDPEWWWLFGLWWGDGTLQGGRNGQIAFSCATKYPHIRQRLLDCLDDAHLPWGESHPSDGAACSSISFCHAALARWLATWRRGRNRKEPPPWVERLPLEFQRALLRGYCDADGALSDRGVGLVSIHLPGLLAARRMLLRLGITSYLSHHRRDRDFSYKGRVYKVQPKYTLRMEEGLEGLGYQTDYAPHDSVRALVIRDGCLWSRVREVEGVQDRTFIPLQTANHTYYTHFGLSHNCDTQSQADDHVATVASLLEGLGVDRAINRYGFSRGWNINRLRTADGFTLDAIGMDKAVRGVRIEETRPDFIILDDLDAQEDPVATIDKKIDILTRKILPTGDDALTVVGVQNLPNKDGIFAQLVDGRADFLMDRHVSGPYPALVDLPEQDWYVEESGADGAKHWRLVGGTPVWAGQDRDACERLLNVIGPRAFAIECLHRVQRLGGKVLQRAWFRVVADWPRGALRVRYWDFAATEEPGPRARGRAADPDWTVGLLLAMERGQFWVLDVQRFRATPQGVEQLVRQTAALDGVGVEIWLEEEGGASGKAVTAQYRLNVLPGYTVRTWHATGSKGERAKPVASAAEAGNVLLLAAPWNAAFLEEIHHFGDSGWHDDQIDALSGAHYALTLGRTLLPRDFSLGPLLDGMTMRGLEARAQTAALLPHVAALWTVEEEPL
jgi:predicted phage terminase large subunit-like protein